jgi:hypothetical protein
MAGLLARYRDKWREAPRGDDTDGRVFSTSLLGLADSTLSETWDEMATRRYGGSVGWIGPLYFDAFRDKGALK